MLKSVSDLLKITLEGPKGCGKTYLLRGLEQIGFEVKQHLEAGSRGRAPIEMAFLARCKPHFMPIPLIMHCPLCGWRHIDKGEFATKPHHTHACQECGHCWRPAVVPTVGVQFLPGFKDAE